MQPVTKTSVAIGPTTIAGYGTSVSMVLASIVAFVSGNGDDQTLGTIVFGVLSALAFVTTQIGRYRQAVEQLRNTGRSPTAWTTPADDEDDEDDEQLEADELHPEATTFNEPDLERIPPDEGDPNPPKVA